MGDGLDDATEMGPLINARRLGEVDGIVLDAVQVGVRLETGGQRAAGFYVGHFYEATVLTNESDDSRVFAEEYFGPIAAITRFCDDDEVLARANACEMGLSACAFTRSPERARRFVAGLKSGMVEINGLALAAASFAAPISQGWGARATRKGSRITSIPTLHRSCFEGDRKCRRTSSNSSGRLGNRR